MAKAYFITGTDTGVGKTVVTAGLALKAIEAGRRVAVMKAVQTGASASGGDFGFVRRIVPEIDPSTPELCVPYSFPFPASPHLSSRMRKASIEISRILGCYRKILLSSPDLVLVEGAGGVYAPLTERLTMLDLIGELAIPVIVVARSSLGTINHTMLTVDALRIRKIKVAGIAMNRWPRRRNAVAKDSAGTIEELSGIPVIAKLREMPELSMTASTGSSALIRKALSREFHEIALF